MHQKLSIAESTNGDQLQSCTSSYNVQSSTCNVSICLDPSRALRAAITCQPKLLSRSTGGNTCELFLSNI